MPGEVNVASIESLEELESAVGKFTAKCLAAFEEAEPEIRRKMEELGERLYRCERAAARCRRAYEEADPEEENLSLLSKRVEEAEDQLRRVGLSKSDKKRNQSSASGSVDVAVCAVVAYSSTRRTTQLHDEAR